MTEVDMDTEVVDMDQEEVTPEDAATQAIVDVQ
jgi:hypothetical protein